MVVISNMTHSPQHDVLDYEKTIFTAGLHFVRPSLTFHPHSWEPAAQKVLSATSWGYINGNCSSGSTYRNNLNAFSRWSIVPARLVPSLKDNSGKEKFPDTKTRVLGQTLPFPIALAPIGVHKIFNLEGEPATARAAASLGIPYIHSTAASTSIEDAAEANGQHSPRWFQLYWPSREHDDITKSMLKRAKSAGYTALFVTLDTYILGWRPSDLDNGYNPFIHPDHTGVEIGLTDPVFKTHFKEKHGYDIEDAVSGDYAHSTMTKGGRVGLGAAAQEWASIVFPGHSHSWEDIKFLQDNWDGPIVLKGIQSVRDAKKCVEVGVQGIVVSNHGGRQQDGGVASFKVLPDIVNAVGHKLEILFDSGIRCGADIIKAVALGAKCVLVGRPYAYGLALGGEDGVRHVLSAMCGDLTMNMHLAGLRQMSEASQDILARE